MTSIPLSLASITLGLVGAMFGAFPEFYRQTVGKASKLEKAGKIWSELVDKRELTDKESIDKLLGALEIPIANVSTLKFETGVNIGQVKTVTAWVSQWDSDGKMLPNYIDVSVVSSLLREREDRQRNRWAFGFVALAFVSQAVVLLAT